MGRHRLLPVPLIAVWLLSAAPGTTSALTIPLIVNTWNFSSACAAGWNAVWTNGGSALDGIEQGVHTCEVEQCDGSVGWGNKPDENGETTLDAMIMDGPSHDVGAVGALRRVRNAIGVARKVLENTNHTLLVGDLATQFALEMGFPEQSLASNNSRKQYQDWKDQHCQPNYWRNVKPDPKSTCGPYQPDTSKTADLSHDPDVRDFRDHDTIGMIAIDKQGRMAVGTSTNGLTHKIPGRVGDSPIPGAGSYVDQDVGGAAQTGDGDVMMRFLPTYHAVELMRSGMSPKNAADDAIMRIARIYPHFSGAIIVANVKGEFAASCWGVGTFHYVAANQPLGGPTLFATKCLDV